MIRLHLAASALVKLGQPLVAALVWPQLLGPKVDQIWPLVAGLGVPFELS